MDSVPTTIKSKCLNFGAKKRKAKTVITGDFEISQTNRSSFPRIFYKFSKKRFFKDDFYQFSAESQELDFW